MSPAGPVPISTSGHGSCETAAASSSSRSPFSRESRPTYSTWSPRATPCWGRKAGSQAEPQAQRGCPPRVLGRLDARHHRVDLDVRAPVPAPQRGLYTPCGPGMPGRVQRRRGVVDRDHGRAELVRGAARRAAASSRGRGAARRRARARAASPADRSSRAGSGSRSTPRPAAMAARGDAGAPAARSCGRPGTTRWCSNAPVRAANSAFASR